jgi:hypothetical protein
MERAELELHGTFEIHIYIAKSKALKLLKLSFLICKNGEEKVCHVRLLMSRWSHLTS